MPLPVDLLQVLCGWLMLAWFGASLALLIGAGTAFSEIVERLWHPAAYLLFPMSGAAFMVDWLPTGMQKFVLLSAHGSRDGNAARRIFRQRRADTLRCRLHGAMLPRHVAGRPVPRAAGQPPVGVLMLAIEHVSKVYATRHGRRKVLNDISFRLGRGEHLAFLAATAPANRH